MEDPKVKEKISDGFKSVENHSNWIFEIPGKLYKSKTIKIVYDENGINEWHEYNDKEGTLLSAPIVKWEELRICHRIQDLEDQQFYYDFKYNGNIYEDKTLEELIWVIKSDIIGKKEKEVENLLFDYGKDELLVKQLKYYDVCGYTKDGWILPDQHKIKFGDGAIQQQLKEHIKKISDLEVDEDKVREKMRRLYDATTIDYKDVLISLCMIHPFCYAMREHVGLIPWVGLGLAAQTGKTSFMEAFIVKFWGHLESVISADTMNSEARGGDYLSLSTFPTPIDDAQDMNTKITAIMKTYLTTDSAHQRLDKKRQYNTNKKLCSPPWFSFNEYPKFFSDIAFLERGIYIPCKYQATDLEQQKFKDILKTIKPGMFGSYIYYKLKEYSVKDLNLQFDFCKDSEKLEGRQNNIFRLIQLGADLFKTCFGIDLNVMEADQLIAETKGLTLWEIINALQDQLTYKERNTKAEWIKTGIDEGVYNNTEGYYYTSANLQDLEKYLDRKIGGVNVFKHLLDSTEFFITDDYKPYKIMGKTKRALFIHKNSDILEM